MSKQNSISQHTNLGPDEKSLYYNNQGLFSDPFLQDRLPYLNKYQNNKPISEYWNIDKFSPDIFNFSFEETLSLWNELEKDVQKHC